MFDFMGPPVGDNRVGCLTINVNTVRGPPDRVLRTCEIWTGLCMQLIWIFRPVAVYIYAVQCTRGLFSMSTTAYNYSFFATRIIYSQRILNKTNVIIRQIGIFTAFFVDNIYALFSEKNRVHLHFIYCNSVESIK